MSAPFDVDDMDVMDNTETVRVHAFTPQGIETIYEEVVGLRRAIHAPKTEGVVQQAQDRLTWHLQASTIDARPKRGWVIEATSDSTFWVILDEAVLSYATRYQVETVKIESGAIP